MLAWVVIYRRHNRQASPFPMLLPNSFPLNSFADPHPLNLVASILYENMGRGGAPSPFQLPTSKPQTSQNCFKSFSCNTYGSPRKCCKQKIHVLAKPFRCNTYKKQGAHPSSQKFFSLLHSPDVRRLRPSDVSTGKRLDVSLACLPSSVRSSKFRIPQSLCLPLLRKLPGHILQAKGFSLSSLGSFSSLFTLCTKSISELLPLQSDPHSF